MKAETGTDAGALSSELVSIMENNAKNPDDSLIKVDTFMKKAVFSVLVNGQPRFNKFDLPKADQMNRRTWIYKELSRLDATSEQFFDALNKSNFVIDYALAVLENKRHRPTTTKIATALASLSVPRAEGWKPFSFGRLTANLFPQDQRPEELVSLLKTVTSTPTVQLALEGSKANETQSLFAVFAVLAFVIQRNERLQLYCFEFNPLCEVSFACINENSFY